MEHSENYNKIKEKLKHNPIIKDSMLDDILSIEEFEDLYLNNPTCILEYIDMLLQKNDYKSLLEYCLNKDIDIIQWILKKNNKYVKSVLIGLIKERSNYKTLLLSPYIYGLLEKCLKSGKRYEDVFDMVIKEIGFKKKEFCLTRKLELQRIEVSKKISLEYLMGLYENAEFPLLTCKLYDLLEGKLKTMYLYYDETDKLIEQYLSSFNTFDDEANDYDPITPRNIKKLVSYRNHMVNSDIVTLFSDKETYLDLIKHITKL